jgi:hypothetical protein
MSEKKGRDPMGSPFEWLFHTSLLIFGAAIALNMAIAYVRPILAWIVVGTILIAVTVLVVAAIHSDRRRW